MNVLGFDIETIPNSGMIDRLPPVEVKAGNLKDPAKIAEKEAAAKAEQLEKMSLSPLYGRVCCWCAEDAAGVRFESCIEEDTDAEEIRVIEAALQLIGYGNRTLLTYNGISFDVPFIYRRAVLLGIDVRKFLLPPLPAMTARYRNDLHHDLMNIWCGVGNYEKLDNLAAAILGDRKNEIDFHDFPEMIKTTAGREELLSYCRQDVALLVKIYLRVVGILI